MKLKKLISITATAMALVFSFTAFCFTACNKDKDNVIDDDGYTPVVRFAVTSDVHIREDDYDEGKDLYSRELLTAFFDTAYDYSSSQTDYNKLDGMFFVGDYTNDGSKKQQTYFFNYLKENAKAETTTRAVMGNHEFYATRSGPNNSAYHVDSMTQAPINFLTYSGYDSVDDHLEINGYHFIFLSMDEYNEYSGEGHEFFSDAKLSWLDGELTKAKNDDPTGKKPIFVFQHEAPENTMLGSTGNSGDSDLTKVLEKYPQVVDFSGHTHRPITDPRSIWQGSFTALNTGSLAYLGVNIAGHPDYDQAGVVALNDKGSWEDGEIEDATRNAGMYYIVEVNAENVVQIKRYDIFTNSFYGETIVLDCIGNPEAFTYTDARKDASTAPIFAQGAQLTVKTTNYKQAIIKIPQATCPDLVQNYRCDIYQGTTFVRSDYRLACTYYGANTPSTIEACIKNLQPSTEYTIKVYAINSWGIASQPLTTTLTTSTVNETTPDILSVVFNADGSATNAVTGETLTKDGNAGVALDTTLSKNVASFDGKHDAYRYSDMVDWYDRIANGFTVETYLYIDASIASKSGPFALFSNQESGGFGFEYRYNTVYFNVHVGSGYKKAEAPVSTGQWVHLVGVYDGSKVQLYVNGSLAHEVAVNGEFNKPSYYAHILCIGADPSYEGKSASFFKGKIAVANLYSHALSAEQIAGLYNNI